MQLTQSWGCGGGVNALEGSQSPFLMRVLREESATWALGSSGRRVDRWTAGQSQREPGGTWACSSNQTSPCTPGMRGRRIQRKPGYQRHGSLLPGLSSDRTSLRAALPTHISPLDVPPTPNGTPYSPPSRTVLPTHSGAPSCHHTSWACLPHQAGLPTTAAGNPSDEQSRLPIPGVLPGPQFQLSHEPQRPPASLIGMLVGPTGGIKALC